jgi:hypothetical protein
MEKFMLLFRGSNAYQSDQPPEALAALKTKMLDWVIELAKKGLHVGSEPLQREGKQVIGSKGTISEGPFGREKEIIGGCTIVLAKDINAAVDIARACPILDTNATIEIRAIQKS